MATSSDHNVTETALDAVKCKLSAATLGFFRDDFLSNFVPKPTRRIPLIHRGYYLRHLAIVDCVTRFLDAAPPGSLVQIVSLGAGFDTLFFRLMQQKRANVRFVEIDCDGIVLAKSKILQSKLDELLPGLTVHTQASNSLAFQCQVDQLQSSYALAASDLGDINRLESLIDASGVNMSVPTVILAECVLSYMEPKAGTKLMTWLSTTFVDAIAVLYDPLALNDTFGATLQHYFAVKGCELLSLRAYQTPRDHCDRLLRQANWAMCRIVDMNAVFEGAASHDERRRVQSLEAFDEYADWVVCNAHYGIFLATTQAVGPLHWSRQFCATKGFVAYRVGECVVRTFQRDDLKAVQKLYQSTHLEYACKAVSKFVNNRVRSGDLADVEASFFHVGTHFWVVETIDKNRESEIIGCVGIKPHLTGSTAELCRLSVAKPARRRGVASVLLTTLEEFASGSGYTAIRLDTIESMAAAQEFYRAKGYTEAAEREKFSTFTLVSFSKLL